MYCCLEPLHLRRQESISGLVRGSKMGQGERSSSTRIFLGMPLWPSLVIRVGSKTQPGSQSPDFTLSVSVVFLKEQG